MCEKKTNPENWHQHYLTHDNLWQILEEFDRDLAENCQAAGCLVCKGKLHRANYPRKPRGLADAEKVENLRDSFCCGRKDCRKRHTPPSLRFLGRRVYVAVVVVLLAAMRQGLTAQRVKSLREELGVDRRTLERWRCWWLEGFAQSRFWKAARARFADGLERETLPLSLCEAFGLEERGCQRLRELLEFLSPLGASSHLSEHGF